MINLALTHSTKSPKPTMPALPLLFLLLIAAASSDLSADRAALLAFRSAVSGRTLFWNTTAPSPCGWSGVRCESNRVAALRLPASSLSGPLPPNTLSSITFLRTLSLRFNHLSGPLPQDLSQLSHLRNLYLQGNHFAGPVPDFIFSLHSLVKLNLASNNFSGEIPAGFNNMTSLRTLYLEENLFTGPLPDIDLPNLDLFNVSSNTLNGSVPKGLVGKPKDAFLNTLLCGRPLDSVCAGSSGLSPAPSTENSNTNSRKKKLSGGAIDGIVIGSVVGLVLLALIIFLLCRKRGGEKATGFADVGVIKNQNQPSQVPTEETNAAAGGVGNGFPPVASTTANGNSKAADAKKLVFFGNASPVFDLEELLRASAEVLGKGSFGTSYKAVLEMGAAVVVKRLKDVTVNDTEFKERIEGVGRMDHENLLPLRAYYYSREEKLLVCDYMPMGSLSALLHGNKGSGKATLDWESRSGIALGVSRGVEYLHFQNPNVSHGSIKSSNILLTNFHEARLSDFGLHPLVGPASSPARAAGYRAPEVTDPRRVSQKADVYSFGVLLLELLTGKAPAHEDGVDLPRWVQSVVREEWTSEVFDVELARGNSEEEMVQLLQLGIDCTAQYPDSRPSMSMVVARVEEIRRVTFRGYRKDHASETE